MLGKHLTIYPHFAGKFAKYRLAATPFGTIATPRRTKRTCTNLYRKCDRFTQYYDAYCRSFYPKLPTVPPRGSPVYCGVYLLFGSGNFSFATGSRLLDFADRHFCMPTQLFRHQSAVKTTHYWHATWGTGRIIFALYDIHH